MPLLRRLDDLANALDRIETRQLLFQRRVLQELHLLRGMTMSGLQTIEQRLTGETDVIAGVKMLLETYHQELTDALADNDPAALQAVLDHIDANKDALAEAVAANALPASPTPGPTITATDSEAPAEGGGSQTEPIEPGASA